MYCQKYTSIDAMCVQNVRTVSTAYCNKLMGFFTKRACLPAHSGLKMSLILIRIGICKISQNVNMIIQVCGATMNLNLSKFDSVIRVRYLEIS